MLVVADMLLSMSVYALIPVLPHWLLDTEGLTPGQTGVAMGVFGLGLYVLGAQCSWLVQRFRRNVVCMWAVVVFALDLALLWYLDDVQSETTEYGVILLQRLLLGAAFGLAQMVLSSTLIIDTCESYQRTEANHGAAWFARFALALGPMAGLVAYRHYGFHGLTGVSVGCALAGLVLIKFVRFPFRAPEDNLHVASLDRFLLLDGHVLFVNLLMVSTVMGLVFSLTFEPLFFAMMMGGFLLALLAQRFVFRDAELKSEVVSGLILLLAALAVMLAYSDEPVSPVLIGLGVGIVGSRFLLFFIKLSRHCKRGTSQSTYFLGWETGVALGLALGYSCFYGSDSCFSTPHDALLTVAIILTAIALAMYVFYTHSWFIRHKNR